MLDLGALVSFIDTRTVLVFFATLLSVITVRSTRRRPRLPPGPQKWPFIGNLPQIIRSIRKHKSQMKMFDEFSQNYGGIFTFSPGGKDIVVVTDYKLIKEVLLDRAEEFNERPTSWLLKLLNQDSGILFSSGAKWRAIRKFTISAFRDFGVGSRTLENIIHAEADIVNKVMAEFEGPIDPKQLFLNAVGNIICNIIFGNRFEYDNKDFLMILDKMDYQSKNQGPTTIDSLFPVVWYLPVNTPGKTLLKNREILREYTYKRIEEHKATYDKDNIRDYVDLFIKVVEEGSESGELTEPHLFQAILDLYFAGMETTATSMTWFILYMVNFPEVQKKCREEIIKVVGQSRKVGMQDRTDLPYVQATILELQRIANIAPFTVPHRNPETAELGGYIIPKGTTILPFIMGPHMNPQYFKDPTEFKPERWLDENGKIKKIEQLIAFGLGPHRCLGEGLAKMELFIFVTTFLQHHKFEVPDGQPMPTLEGENTGITLQAKPYEIIMKPI